METVSALLAICAGNSPIPGKFPTQRPATWSFHVFFDLRLNKRLSKQWWGWWFETLSRPLWRHRNDFGIGRFTKILYNRSNEFWTQQLVNKRMYILLYIAMTSHDPQGVCNSLSSLTTKKTPKLCITCSFWGETSGTVHKTLIMQQAFRCHDVVLFICSLVTAPPTVSSRHLHEYSILLISFIIRYSSLYFAFLPLKQEKLHTATSF